MNRSRTHMMATRSSDEIGTTRLILEKQLQRGVVSATTGLGKFMVVYGPNRELCPVLNTLHTEAWTRTKTVTPFQGKLG